MPLQPSRHSLSSSPLISARVRGLQHTATRQCRLPSYGSVVRRVPRGNERALSQMGFSNIRAARCGNHRMAVNTRSIACHDMTSTRMFERCYNCARDRPARVIVRTIKRCCRCSEGSGFPIRVESNRCRAFCMSETSERIKLVSLMCRSACGFPGVIQ